MGRDSRGLRKHKVFVGGVVLMAKITDDISGITQGAKKVAARRACCRGLAVWLVAFLGFGLVVGSSTVGFAQSAAPSSLSRQARGAYNIKLRAIEERVNELKERIFQSKARLMQLQERVLNGAIAGSKATIIHRNQMGESFRLARAQYSLDGTPIFNRVDTGGGPLSAERFEVFKGSVTPGNHQISVFLEYQGNGFGVFSYLDGYRFRIRSSYTFSAEEGKITGVSIIGYEKGGVLTQLSQRPAIRYDVITRRALRRHHETEEGLPKGARN